MKKVIYCIFTLLMLVVVSGCENNNQDNNQKPKITQTKWNQLLDVSYSDYAVDIKYKGRNDTDYTYYHVEVESTIAGEKVFIQTDTETTYMESFSSQYYKIVNNEGIPCEEFANPFFEYLLELKDLYEEVQYDKKNKCYVVKVDDFMYLDGAPKTDYLTTYYIYVENNRIYKIICDSDEYVEIEFVKFSDVTVEIPEYTVDLSKVPGNAAFRKEFDITLNSGTITCCSIIGNHVRSNNVWIKYQYVDEGVIYELYDGTLTIYLDIQPDSIMYYHLESNDTWEKEELDKDSSILTYWHGKCANLWDVLVAIMEYRGAYYPNKREGFLQVKEDIYSYTVVKFIDANSNVEILLLELANLTTNRVNNLYDIYISKFDQIEVTLPNV